MALKENKRRRRRSGAVEFHQSRGSRSGGQLCHICASSSLSPPPPPLSMVLNSGSRNGGDAEYRSHRCSRSGENFCDPTVHLQRLLRGVHADPDPIRVQTLRHTEREHVRAEDPGRPANLLLPVQLQPGRTVMCEDRRVETS